MKHACIAAAWLALLPTLALAQAVTYQDRSGTITLGGTAQTLMPAWTGRHGCIIQNQSAGNLWVTMNGSAVAAPPSFLIVPGAQYQCMVPASDGAHSIIGATTAQAFAAREW
jgi:hypothetical protein